LIQGFSTGFARACQGLRMSNKERQIEIEMTRMLVTQRPPVKATLYFDSPNQESIKALPNFSYEFSGGACACPAATTKEPNAEERSQGELPPRSRRPCPS
jgi:hypothetical protein